VAIHDEAGSCEAVTTLKGNPAPFPFGSKPDLSGIIQLKAFGVT
jgi:hypothetical protein